MRDIVSNPTTAHRLQRRSFTSTSTFLTFMVLPLLVMQQKSGEEIFRQIFYPLEKSMRITINPSKFQVSLLQGKVTLPKLDVGHPEQGTFARVRNIEFPLGLVLGTVKPGDATITAQEAVFAIDLAKERFWDNGAPEGKPIPGSPDLVSGTIRMLKTDVTIRRGAKGPLSIAGAEATLSGVSIPAASWTKGEAPAGRWARLSMKGGTIALGGALPAASLERLDVSFTGNVLRVEELRLSVPGAGGVKGSGTIACPSGAPGAHDLAFALDAFRLFPSDPASPAVTGTLALKGKKGALALSGTLAADGLKEASWQRQGCASTVKLKAKVVAGTQQMLLSGSLCAGKLSAAGGKKKGTDG